jgi:hypothetical protein
MNIKVRKKNVIHIPANSSNDKIMKIESYQNTHCFILIALQFPSLSELYSYRCILKYELQYTSTFHGINDAGYFLSQIHKQTILYSGIWLVMEEDATRLEPNTLIR